MKGILGRKVGMTQVFTKDGKLIPVTVVSVEPNVVMQIKTVEKDGYNAIQLGVEDKKEKNSSRASVGHAKKANTLPKRFLKEMRDMEGSYNVGDTIKADLFEVGDIVDVTGTSKGKGFTGVIKRHGQSRGPETHGSNYHRRPGSMGTMLPKRVLKGKRLSGHMGVDTVTVQNLEIIEVNTNENYILVSGNVPGAKESFILIKSAVKNTRKKDAKDILSYQEETVVDEVVEPVAEETTDVEEAPVEETEAVETTEEVQEEVNDAEEVEDTKEETVENTDTESSETTEE